VGRAAGVQTSGASRYAMSPTDATQGQRVTVADPQGCNALQATRDLPLKMQRRCTSRVTTYGGPVTIASAETIGKDQTAGSDRPAHQLVTRYAQNRDSVDWAISEAKIIMAQPSPLSALCTANEVAVAIEAGSRAESFVIVNGSDLRTASVAVVSTRSCRSTETF
jgi:hypothetical protein